MTEFFSHLLEIVVAMALSLVGMAYEPEATEPADAQEARFMPAVWQIETTEFVAIGDFHNLTVDATANCAVVSKARSDMPVFIGVQS